MIKFGLIRVISAKQPKLNPKIFFSLQVVEKKIAGDREKKDEKGRSVK